ncbi:hypothetical protein OPV22_009422 [Ensete ventricosum]|uniref:Uncharacterized protein n=1 Tax=Ensete ventricosum TaxID=4639 RepID=A0AAV8RAZ0_ENSVE|nr:hypothetical protein OPV22_009422 [Ensete ventricosum]
MEGAKRIGNRVGVAWSASCVRRRRVAAFREGQSDALFQLSSPTRCRVPLCTYLSLFDPVNALYFSRKPAALDSPRVHGSFFGPDFTAHWNDRRTNIKVQIRWIWIRPDPSHVCLVGKACSSSLWAWRIAWHTSWTMHGERKRITAS